MRLYHTEFKEADRDKVLAAANEVAEAAKAGSDGADAKEKAKEKSDEIDSRPDDTTSSEEKEAAKFVSGIIQGMADDAKTADVIKVANSAVIQATPFSKAKLSVGAVILEAAHQGKWGAALRIKVDQEQISQDVAASMGVTTGDLFNLTVREDAPGGATEKFLNLTTKLSSRRIDKVLKKESDLIRWDGDYPASPPAVTEGSDLVSTAWNTWQVAKKVVQDIINSGGTPTQAQIDAVEDAKTTYQEAAKSAEDAVSDGINLTIADFLPSNGETEKKGLYALEELFAKGSLFNLLCIPPYKDSDSDGTADSVDPSLISSAVKYCEDRRAMFLVDPPPDWESKKDAIDGLDSHIQTRSKNAALFFPRLKQPNPLRDNQVEEFVPCGAVAGIMARTDTERGVWKAPAGIDATLRGVQELSIKLTDEENGELNPLGVNCLRSFPVIGRIVWGARTLRGADILASEWKYIPIRRLALFIEESLFRGTQWVVFEPNDEPLWAQIRMNVGSFMHTLFRQGAFQGTSPKQAYFVKCDKETNPQNDIDRGIVNIVVGFAPLKPAEFVIIKLQQIAGDIEF